MLNLSRSIITLIRHFASFSSIHILATRHLKSSQRYAIPRRSGGMHGGQGMTARNGELKKAIKHIVLIALASFGVGE